MLLPGPRRAALLAACVLAACARGQTGIGGAGGAGAAATGAGTGGRGGSTTSAAGSTGTSGATGSTATAGGSTCTGGDLCSAGSTSAGGGASSTATSTAAASTTSTSSGAGGAACNTPTVTNLTPGNEGALTGVPQSFNETRALAISPLGADAVVSSMTLTGLDAAGASATVGARIYDAASQALVASATAGIGPGMNETVAVTITATLTAGHSYLVGFFVNDGQMASATLFQPTTLPYTAGPFTVTAIGDVGSDVYPANMNIYAPRVTLQTCGP